MMNVRSVIPVAACVLVVAGIGLGFSVIGGPAHNRQVSLDEGRLSAMDSIARDLVNESDLRMTLPEPRPYEASAGWQRDITYVRTGKRTYRLCATFELSTVADAEEHETPRFPPHPAGPACFTFDTKSASPIAAVPWRR